MVLDEVDEILDSVAPRQINLKSFEYKKKLNDKIWVEGFMNRRVRPRLLSVAAKFFESLKLDESVVPVDIIMVGSLASYNWSKYSDIDLHIVVDFSKVSPNVELVQNYFNSKKTDWNNQHGELTIFGYPVEVYVQDINEENAAEGVYSIKYDRWVKIPHGGTLHMDRPLIKRQAAKVINTIDYYCDVFTRMHTAEGLEKLSEKADLLFDTITNGRKLGLKQEGEGSPGNIVFKILRRTEHIKKLKDLRNRIYDKLNCVY